MCMCVKVEGRRTCEDEDSAQREFYNGFLLHSGLFGLIIRFLPFLCPDPWSCLSPTSPIVTTAESLPAIFYYRTTTFKYLFFPLPNHCLSLHLCDSLFSPLALYPPPLTTHLSIKSLPHPTLQIHFCIQGRRNAARTCTADSHFAQEMTYSRALMLTAASNFVLGEIKESVFSH